jgi:hypothetical protein
MATLTDLLRSQAADGSVIESKAGQAYLQHLTTLPLADLEAEPRTLAQLSTQLDGDLSSLCFRSYPTFLLAHECTNSLMASLSELEGSLNSFIDASVSLHSAARSFETAIKPTLETRSRIMEVQDHVDTVGQVLDLPRVVGNCIRGGQWNEAMEWSKRVSDLEAQLSEHTKGQAAMGAVRKGVEGEISSLKTRVLQTFGERSLKLPGAVRSINLLRRLDDTPSLEEEQLQLILLTGRWQCLLFQTEALQATFSSATDTAAADERSRFLKRWIEIWREVIGDAVNMYQEIFLPAPTSSNSPNPSAPATLTESNIKRARSNLTLFLHSALRHLVATLELHLPHIPPVSSLSTLLTQLSYCSAAFARFGFEFKSQVEELVVQRVQFIIEDRLKQGTSSFLAELSPRRPTPVEGILLAPEALGKVLALPEPQEAEALSFQPPHPLTLLPPLARYINAVASALNELRLLPFVSLYPALRDTLLDSFESTSNALLALVESTQPVTIPFDEEPDEKEARERVARDRKAACRIVLLHWARGVLPWSEKALRRGVYEALEQQEPARVQTLKDRIELAIAGLAPAASSPIGTCTARF